ncbi:MAG TPA: MFS transporter, partial [Sphingomicrobium sp.]
AFVVLMLAGICAYTIQGIGYALANYFYAFVWGMTGADFIFLTLSLFAGAAAAFVLAPRVARRGSKPRWAILFALCGAAISTGPYWLRLAGLFPEPGDPTLLPILFTFYILGTMCSVSGFILGASMMADVVEDSEAKTGRRSEGVFFAGSFFVQKCTTGLGIFLASLILSLAGFPAAAKPGMVDVATLDRLSLLFGVIYLGLAGLAAYFFSRFPFGRAEHEARLAGFAVTGDPSSSG